MDVITDFNRREGDHIDVRAIDANPIVPRNQDFTFIGTDEFSARGQIRYFTDGTDTFIALNTDAEFFDNDAVIRVVGVHTVDAFWVIRRPHRRKKSQCVMNRQQSTSTSGKHHSENHKGEGSTPSARQLPWPNSPGHAQSSLMTLLRRPRHVPTHPSARRGPGPQFLRKRRVRLYGRCTGGTQRRCRRSAASRTRAAEKK